MMRKLLQEPLFHFLLLGAVLFGTFALLNDGESERGSRTVIEIAKSDVDWLIAAWSRQWRRPPTETELRGLIADRVREEVLYREALAMGLDRDDEIVRRRLAQKMEFLTKDLVLMTEPADSALRVYFEQEADRYHSTEERAFTHIYFSTDERGEAAVDAARAALATLQNASTTVERAPELGDRLLLPSSYTPRSQERVARDFGREFAAGLFATEPGAWSGPIGSAYGVHLVRVTEWTAATMPPYEEVMDRVRADYDAARRTEANEAVFQALLDRYDVQVDEDAIQARLVTVAVGKRR